MRSRIAIPLVSCLIGLMVASSARAHGLPIDVIVRDGQVKPFELDGQPVFSMGVLTQPAGSPGLQADDPGFGVTNRANGVVLGETLGFDVTSSLLYWDGTGLASTASELQLNSPDGVRNYVVGADSPPQAGLELGTYDGRRFWDTHGLFTLSLETASPGVYGVGIRLTSDLHDASDEFLLPLVYDPLEQWDEDQLGTARRLLDQMLDGMLGDLDNDGLATLQDLDLLCVQVGMESTDLRFDLDADGLVAEGDVRTWRVAHEVPMGDTNLDGRVGFDDFLTFTNHFGRAPENIAGWSAGDFNCDRMVDFSDFLLFAAHFGQQAAVAVPEPSMGFGLVLVLLTVGRRWQLL